MDEPRLTADQLAAWATFTSPEWQPFREAWLGRGLLWPPAGNPDDDPESSLRARLWEVAEARPNDLGRWVREARGRMSSAILSEVFDRWRGHQDAVDVAADAAEMEAEWTRRADRKADAEALRSIMAGLR